AWRVASRGPPLVRRSITIAAVVMRLASLRSRPSLSVDTPRLKELREAKRDAAPGDDKHISIPAPRSAAVGRHGGPEGRTGGRTIARPAPTPCPRTPPGVKDAVARALGRPAGAWQRVSRRRCVSFTE